MEKPGGEELAVIHSWTARKGRPVTILYDLGVFLAFMAISHFVFHSGEAVLALAMAAVGSLVPLLPMVLTRIEYRLTEKGIQKRMPKGGQPGSFKEVCAWEELSHVVPTGHGFKFYRSVGNARGLARFWKAHVSDKYSGEVQVEPRDQDEVFRVFAERSIRTSNPR